MTTTTHDDATLLLDHPIGRRGRLAVRLAAAEVRLVADDSDRVTVRVPGGRSLPDRVVLETTDDGLTIREQEALGITFGLGRRTVQVEIGLPAETDVTVDTASGWIDARGLRGEQRYRTASGEVRLLEAAGRIDLNAVSGDATLALAAAAELAIRTVSGDVSVEGGSISALRLQTTSGDVLLDSPLTGRTGNSVETLSGDVDLRSSGDIRVEARTVSGDVSSELPHRTEGRMGRRTLILGSGSIELSFRSVSGDLHIHDADHAASGAVPASPPLPAIPPLPPIGDLTDMPPLPAIPPLPGSSPAGSTTSHVEAGADGPAASRVAGGSTVAGDDRMTILRSLERGEIDVAEAMRRLADLDSDGDQDVGADVTSSAGPDAEAGAGGTDA